MLVLCNLKARNMRGIKSRGMVSIFSWCCVQRLRLVLQHA